MLANLKKKFSKKPQPKGATLFLLNATVLHADVSESESEETSEESSTEETDSDQPEQPLRPQVKKQHSQKVQGVVLCTIREAVTQRLGNFLPIVILHAQQLYTTVRHQLIML